MASILVSGGRKIVGTARVSGAKNAALPILAATLIARGPVELTDCPHLSDVENMLKILRSLGVSCSLEAGTAHIDAAKAERCIMPQSISNRSGQQEGWKHRRRQKSITDFASNVISWWNCRRKTPNCKTTNTSISLPFRRNMTQPRKALKNLPKLRERYKNWRRA